MIFGGVVLAGVILYYAFMAIDGMGLRPGPVCWTRSIAGPAAPTAHRSSAIARSSCRRSTPEMYVLSIDVEGVPSEALVDKALHDAVGLRDRVRVTYQRRRFTGAVQIVAVTR